MPSLSDEFQTFWQHYPRRIGRLAAFKAYGKARRLASAEQILDGVRRYCEHLPEDLQFVCHASTFLNQGRWDDEYEVARPVAPRWECQHAVKCNSKSWCLTLVEKEAEGWLRDPATGHWSRRESA